MGHSTEIRGDIRVGTSVSGVMSFGHLNSSKIRADLDYHLDRCGSKEVSEGARDHYARAAIVFLAFYLECLSNSLTYNSRGRTDRSLSKKLSKTVKTKTVKKLIAFHANKRGGSFPLDYGGILDLFTVRDQVFAHARDSTILTSNDESRITKIAYRKFTTFPNAYPNFGTYHARELAKEVFTFLRAYTALLNNDLPGWFVSEFEKKPNNQVDNNSR